MTSREVEAVWIFRYNKTNFKACYGRRLGTEFSKDYLQINTACSKEFDRVIGRAILFGDEESFSCRWPGGDRTGKIEFSSDRPHLLWPTNNPPDLWRLHLNIDPTSPWTFEGNPGLATEAEANDEWKRFDSKNQRPWLTVTKLRDEKNILHLRAYLGDPPPHLEHCGTAHLPLHVRTAMSRLLARRGCGIVPIAAQPPISLWFDPDRNHDAFSEVPPETRRLPESAPEVLDAHDTVEAPEVLDARDDVARRVGHSQSGQGFRVSSAQRRAVEMRAMEMARTYYAEHGWTLIDDVSLHKSYDFHCSRDDGSELRVEVKGTTGTGDSVLLTRNEVIHAHEHHPKVALFIVGNISLTESDGKHVASGGDVSVLEPWNLDDNDLTAIGYSYVVPPLT